MHTWNITDWPNKSVNVTNWSNTMFSRLDVVGPTFAICKLLWFEYPRRNFDWWPKNSTLISRKLLTIKMRVLGGDPQVSASKFMIENKVTSYNCSPPTCPLIMVVFQLSTCWQSMGISLNMSIANNELSLSFIGFKIPFTKIISFFVALNLEGWTDTKFMHFFLFLLHTSTIHFAYND